VPLQIIEVQNGEYLEEDDIVRFDDDYSRHKNNERKPLPEVTKRSS
jgi:mannose-1-phosphate guanylyltransferase/mannose-6-phosphate isomerase